MKNATKENSKFYQRTWFTILMLIVFFPVGLYLMWKYNKFPFVIRVVVSVFFGLMVVSSMFDSSSEGDRSSFSEGIEAGYSNAMEESKTEKDLKEENSETLEEDAAELTKANIDTSIEVKAEENIAFPLHDEKNIFDTGEYLFITNEDLSKYCVNMQGVKIYVVTDVDDMKDNLIQSTLADGFMMSGFDVGDNYSKYESMVEKGDTVAILGTVAENTDYSFFGSSVRLIDCKIFAIGEEAESYKKDKTDDGLSQYLVVTEEVADSNDVSEEDYKSLCQQLNYEDILRNPDSYDGKYCIVSGTVDQVIEGWFGSFTIFVMDENGNKWGCTYSYDEGETHILEGDSVVMYGKCNGVENTETVIGEQVTLPHIDIEYWD